ncbi:claudin-1-like isoform X2 [Sinocyclocheilus anshuiensis]|uniref:claudin-1-like isoform X2 n=1 Tax=Sinocyclocheilus anshuiensis TaxID=1608454 RepID=UPI0007B80348|nr:PREDICTED: claudin-1-like isoform X2 [Sinocyclocheilus anshuiensis]
MALQLIGYILSIIGLCGLIIGTFTNEWKILGHDNDKTVILDKNKGLWMECSIDSSSIVHCTSYNSLLHQTFEIQVGRAIMIVSIVFSSLAALVAISGLKCTRCIEENEKLKDRAAFLGGILSVCGGLFALGITSWFIYGIVDDFFQNDTETERYVVGRSLIGAFVASMLCLFGGILLCTCSVTHLQSNTILSKHPVSMNPGKDYV